MAYEYDLLIKRMRYGFDKPCRYCGMMLQWWRTPKGHWVGIQPNDLENHWANCPNKRKYEHSYATHKS